jgi:hypothetical protein
MQHNVSKPHDRSVSANRRTFDVRQAAASAGESLLGAEVPVLGDVVDALLLDFEHRNLPGSARRGGEIAVSTFAVTDLEPSIDAIGADDSIAGRVRRRFEGCAGVVCLIADVLRAPVLGVCTASFQKERSAHNNHMVRLGVVTWVMISVCVVPAILIPVATERLTSAKQTRGVVRKDQQSPFRFYH